MHERAQRPSVRSAQACSSSSSSSSSSASVALPLPLTFVALPPACWQMLRRAIGLEAPEGEDDEDILSSFQEIASGLQDGIDSYDR